VIVATTDQAIVLDVLRVGAVTHQPVCKRISRVEMRQGLGAHFDLQAFCPLNFLARAQNIWIALERRLDSAAAAGEKMRAIGPSPEERLVGINPSARSRVASESQSVSGGAPRSRS